MTKIEHCYIYGTKKSRVKDCESGNGRPKLRRLRRSIRITKRAVEPPWVACVLSCFFWLLLSAVLAAATVLLLTVLSPYPLRPSCLILWKAPRRSCDDARTALLNRLQDWAEVFPNCENCSHYQVVTADVRSLWLWHRSAAFRADISLLFSPTSQGGCRVLGFCRSRGSFWPLDGGASFCALSQLATSTGFLGAHFTQETNDPVCTQSSSAVCPHTITRKVPRVNITLFIENQKRQPQQAPPEQKVDAVSSEGQTQNRSMS